MRIHRIWTISALCWFFVLFNVERVFPEVNIASFVYGLCTLAGMAILASPALRRQRFAIVTGGFITLWVVGKCVFHYGINLTGLPIALMECLSLIMSLYLCRKVAWNTEEFEVASKQMLEVLKATSVPDLRQSEVAMLEEIRRARRHERPLTFISLTPGKAQPEELASLVQKLATSLSKEYIIGGISRVLQSDTKTHDMAARVGDRILMLLPETNAKQAERMAKRVRSQIHDRIGVPMSSNVYAFGTNEVTLSGVLDRMGMPSLESNDRIGVEGFDLQGNKPDPKPQPDAGRETALASESHVGRPASQTC